MNAQHLARYIIRPVLDRIGLWSLPAEELVLGTAAQESGLSFLKQLGGGPALGLWQMEPATHDDIWENYLAFHPQLRAAVLEVAGLGRAPGPDLMVGNLWYAAAMCRVHYRRVPKPLPGGGDWSRQAAYWKEHYNTIAGAGTAAEYIASWNLYVLGEGGERNVG